MMRPVALCAYWECLKNIVIFLSPHFNLFLTRNVNRVKATETSALNLTEKYTPNKKTRVAFTYFQLLSIYDEVLNVKKQRNNT